MFKQHRIPTLIGILFLVLTTAATVFLLQSSTKLFTKADPGSIPSQIKITNISDSGFSVSWTTPTTVSGFIQYGEEVKIGQNFTDDRDQTSGTTGNFLTHHVTLNNLKPQTKYYYKIGSGTKIYDNNGKPYEITTASTLANPPLADPAYGSILKIDGSPAEGSIVYLSIAGTTPLSTLVSASGNWIATLNNARSQDLTSWASYDRQASIIEIFVQAGTAGTATAKTTTTNDNPVPDITLGKTYDFKKAITTDASSSANIIKTKVEEPQVETVPDSKFTLTELDLPTEATTTGSLTIKNPSTSELVNTAKPAINGTGPAGRSIKITVESDPVYQGTVPVNAQGQWVWTPPQNLTPGEHTVTISYLGQTIKQKFTVLAAGESNLPAITATPSGNLTTPTPTLKPTPTIKLSPTPTVKITPTPTLRPTPTLKPTPTPVSEIPVSGDLTLTFAATMIGLILIITGFSIKAILAHD